MRHRAPPANALEQTASSSNDHPEDPPRHSTSSCAHSPKRVCRASPMPSARSASLDWSSPMRHQPERTTDAPADPRARLRLACCHRGRQTQAPLGLGSGDRFGALRGRLRVPQEEGATSGETTRIAGKRFTKRVSHITSPEAEASMVRRGSTVRVRQRASTKCLQIGISSRLSMHRAGTPRVHLR